MTRSLNKVMIIGNVGKDPEMSYTGSGIPFATIRVATSESWKDKDGNWQEHTEWHSVVAWRGLAEVMNKIISKGARVYIEGKLQNRIYEDRDGNKRYHSEIVADNIILLDYKDAKSENKPYEQKGNRSFSSEQDYTAPPVTSPDDDIPF